MTNDRKQLLMSCVDMALAGMTPEQMNNYLANKMPVEEIDESIETIRATVLWRYTLKDGTIEIPTRANRKEAYPPSV